LFGRDKSTTVDVWAHGKQRVAISAAMDAEDDDGEIKYDVALCAMPARRVSPAHRHSAESYSGSAAAPKRMFSSYGVSLAGRNKLISRIYPRCIIKFAVLSAAGDTVGTAEPVIWLSNRFRCVRVIHRIVPLIKLSCSILHIARYGKYFL
jgi:hypothetical protein